MKKIGIIGGGFSGTMTAVHLINNSSVPIEIIIINNSENFNKGVAYSTYSKSHLLNVAAGKMSAFADNPDHFLNWVIQQEHFLNADKNAIANSFLPRHLYGEYLKNIWEKTITSEKAKNIKINWIESLVTDMDVFDNSVSISLIDDKKINVDTCVIASGNQFPRNPNIKNSNFYTSKNYFQNPWDKEAVSDANSKLPILIIGNGLTMVDTVLGLLENDFKNVIYSISPNGFNILPHRHNGTPYTKLIEELKENISLPELVKLFNKHVKHVRKLGLSAESIVDSLRPHTQNLWQSMSTQEKKQFMSRLRHLWGVARHRIPLNIHDKIQQLRIDNKLHIYAGRLNDLIENADEISALFYNKKNRKNETIIVSRVINCTGPETDLMQLEDNHFLKKCYIKGIVSQDELKLGINADPSNYRIIDRDGNLHKNLFTIGTNLKGVLWETTAVPEIRLQAEKLAKGILK